MDINPAIYMHGDEGVVRLCDSMNGGGQGNAMTPILFAIVINSVLKPLAIEFPQLIIKAVHDDISVLGEAQVIFNEFWNQFQVRVQPTKLTVQRAKTQAYATNEGEIFPFWVKRPSVNGSYGIELCQIPIGDEEYIRAKVNDIHDRIAHQIEKVTTVVAQRDQRLAISTLYYSSQNLADYYLRCISPTYTKQFGDNIDDIIKKMYNMAAGVVIFGAHANENDRWKSFVEERAQLRIKTGGLGIRLIQSKQPFLAAINTVFTRIGQSGEGNKAIWPSIARDVGTMDGDNRWQQMFELAYNHRITTVIKAQWKRVEDIRECYVQQIGAIDPSWQMPTNAIFNSMQADDLNFGKEHFKLGRAINDCMQELRQELLQNQMDMMSPEDCRGASYRASQDSKTAQSLVQFQWTAAYKIIFTDTEFGEAMANYMGLESPVARGLTGRTIHGMRQRTADGLRHREVDAHGHELKCANGVKGADHIRVMHDDCNNFVANECRQAGARVTGGIGNTCKDLFSQCIDQDSTERERQLMVPDGVLDTTTMVAVEGSGSKFNCNKFLWDAKTLAGGKTYAKTAHMQHGQYAVNKREQQVNKDYYANARQLDRKYNHTAEGEMGKIEKELAKYGRPSSMGNGTVMGLVFGPYAECSSGLEDLLDFIAEHRTRRAKEGSSVDAGRIKALIKNELEIALGLHIHRGWARVLIGRANNVARKELGVATIMARQAEEHRELAVMMQWEHRRH